MSAFFKGMAYASVAFVCWYLVGIQQMFVEWITKLKWRANAAEFQRLHKEKKLAGLHHFAHGVWLPKLGRYSS